MHDRLVQDIELLKGILNRHDSLGRIYTLTAFKRAVTVINPDTEAAEKEFSMNIKNLRQVSVRAKKSRVNALMQKVAEHPYFTSIFIPLVIIGNTAILSLEKYPATQDEIST